MNVEKIKLFMPGIRVYPVSFQGSLYTIELRKMYGRYGASFSLYAYIHKYVDEDVPFCRHTGNLVFEHIFISDEILTLNLLNDSSQNISFRVSDLTNEDLEAFAPEIISLLFQKFESEANSKNVKTKFMKDNIKKTHSWDGIIK